MSPRCLIFLGLALPAAVAGQVAAMGDSPPLTYTRTVTVPLNALLLHDKALDAWTWTFGKEPAGKTLRTDREQGVIEGLARVNYRSEKLALREETMGVIQYRVVVITRAGECRVTVSELTHTGNRGTARGGIHLGLLLRGDRPAKNVKGIGANTGRRIYAEVKAVAEARVLALLQAFDARLRANAEP